MLGFRRTPDRWEVELPDDPALTYDIEIGTEDLTHRYALDVATLQIRDGAVVTTGGKRVRNIAVYLVPDVVGKLQRLRADLRDSRDSSEVALSRTLEDMPLHPMSLHDWRRHLDEMGDWRLLSIDEQLVGGSGSVRALSVDGDTMRIEYDVMAPRDDGEDRLWARGKGTVRFRSAAFEPEVRFLRTRRRVGNGQFGGTVGSISVRRSRSTSS